MEEERVCPVCGSRNLAKIYYGIEAYAEDAKKQIEEGKALFVCCKTGFDDPEYRCLDCGADIL
ncbi:MAG: hypothetical protein IIZ47_00560 [Erysipelotrichaceae bacterium]|nr:hypothetical protein [Erysipelotrichaceae bacterium]